MATGTVKWFNNAKGYGFICPIEGGEDIFAHFSAIEMDGYKSLKAGQKVNFEINRGPKGLHAINIRPSQEATAEAAHAESGTTIASETEKASTEELATADD